jgi:hypothetical protein
MWYEGAMHRWGRALALLVVLAALVACNDGAGTTGAPASPAPSVPPAASASASAAPNSALATAPTATVAPPLSPRRAALLANDVADLVAVLKGATPNRRIQVVGDLFILIADDPKAPFDAAVALTQHMVDVLYTGGRLAHRPDRAVLVFLYPSPSALAVAISHHEGDTQEPPGLGLFDPEKRTILACPDAKGQMSGHEIAHPLILADFPHAPAWAMEGLPSLFEVVDFSTQGEIHGKAHFRLQTLRDALASKDPAVAASVSLDALFAMTTDATFRGPREYLHYALAREALRWLDANGKLWSWWSLFREGALEDPTGVAAFTKVVGKSPAAATADWIAWIQSREAEGTP